MEKRKPTITSLAQELGLSVCTISKVLNKSFDGFSYAPATVRRVEALAKKRGYIPNIHARSLRTKRSLIAGLVVPSGIPFFTGTLVESIEGALRDSGYETIVGHSTADVEKEKHLLRNVLGKGVDGLLWIPYSDAVRPEKIGVSADYPLVILDRPGCSNQFPAVVTDNRAASSELAAELASLGVREVTVLTSDCGDKSIEERERGVVSVFGSRVKRHRSLNEIGAAKSVVAEILPGLKGGSFLCLSQSLAMGALQAMRESGIRPGVEVGFACFDNLPLCEIWYPSLCRVEQDIDVLAREGVRLLLEKIRDPKMRQPLETRVAARLIKGDSLIPKGVR